MKSKTSYFNRTLFLNLLKRYWPIFAGYFVIWLILLPITLANVLSYSQITLLPYADDLRIFAASAGNQILRVGLYGGVIMSGIFGILIAMAAFNYLYNARSVSMMCSLPVKREGVFLSVFTSGIVGMFVLNIIIFLISLAVVAAYGITAMGSVYLLQWLAMVCMLNLFFFGFATLVASFTGNILVLPIVYVVLNFTVYVVEMLIRTVMSMFIYGISSSDSSTLAALSPPVKLLTRLNIVSVVEKISDDVSMEVGYTYTGWTTLVIYAAVGIVFALLAMLMIKNRRMETAGDVVAVKPLRPIFKYCLSVGCALVLGLLIYTTVFSNNTLFGVQGMLFMLLFMLFGAFVGYFAAEMLMQKTLHVFSGRSWIGMGITAVLITSLMFCGEFDVFGIERRVPDTNDVQGVSLSCAGENVLLEQPENIEATTKLQSDIISHKDANEQYTGNYNTMSNYITMTYTFMNGKTLTREYVLYTEASDDIYTLNDLMNVQEAVDYRKELSVPVSIDTIADAYISYYDKAQATYMNIELSSEEAYELYSTCILPDIDDGLLGKIWLVTDDTYSNTVYDCTLNFSIEQRLNDNEYRSDYFYTTLTISAERTYNWIAENYALELCTMGESREIMNAQTDSEAKLYAEKYAVSVG